MFTTRKAEGSTIPTEVPTVGTSSKIAQIQAMLQAGRSRVRIPSEAGDMFLFSKTSRLALRTTQPAIK